MEQLAGRTGARRGELRTFLAGHPHLVETGEGWVNVRRLADGLAFTHELSAVEREAGVLSADDDLALWVVPAQTGLPLAGGGEAWQRLSTALVPTCDDTLERQEERAGRTVSLGRIAREGSRWTLTANSRERLAAPEILVRAEAPAAREVARQVEQIGGEPPRDGRKARILELDSNVVPADPGTDLHQAGQDSLQRSSESWVDTPISLGMTPREAALAGGAARTEREAILRRHAEWAYWDLWFCTVAVADHDGDWDALDAAIQATQRWDRESLWCHLVDLTARLHAAGLTAADLPAACPTRRGLLSKARTKVSLITGRVGGEAPVDARSGPIDRVSSPSRGAWPAVGR